MQSAKYAEENFRGKFFLSEDFYFPFSKCGGHQNLSLCSVPGIGEMGETVGKINGLKLALHASP